MESETGWYLALGDSVAAGYQPCAPFDMDGGYVGHVLNASAWMRPIAG